MVRTNGIVVVVHGMQYLICLWDKSRREIKIKASNVGESCTETSLKAPTVTCCTELSCTANARLTGFADVVCAREIERCERTLGCIHCRIRKCGIGMKITYHDAVMRNSPMKRECYFIILAGV